MNGPIPVRGITWIIAAASWLALSGCATHLETGTSGDASFRGSTRINYARSAKPIHLDRENIQTFSLATESRFSGADGEAVAKRIFDYAKANMVRSESPPPERKPFLYYRSDGDPSASF